jgi:hypothetical protein
MKWDRRFEIQTGRGHVTEFGSLRGLPSLRPSVFAQDEVTLCTPLTK